jgi:tRNA G18 (ribose-2'-O)-methylase SpoU
VREFTPRKLLSLKPQTQQKLLSRLLHRLYLDPTNTDLLDEYNCYQNWLNEPPLSSAIPAHIAIRYHQHIRSAGIDLPEHAFLPLATHHDAKEPLPSLGYTIYLDELRSAHNVGSILRTVEAFRLGKVIFSENTPFIHQKKVQDTSMGSWEWVECLQGSPKDLPRPWVAFETTPEAKSLPTTPIPQGATLIIGNEELGVSEELLSQADLIVQIPLRGKKNSLNVANAFAIAAYAACQDLTNLRAIVE